MSETIQDTHSFENISSDTETKTTTIYDTSKVENQSIDVDSLVNPNTVLKTTSSLEEQTHTIQSSTEQDSKSIHTVSETLETPKASTKDINTNTVPLSPSSPETSNTHSFQDHDEDDDFFDDEDDDEEHALALKKKILLIAKIL